MMVIMDQQAAMYQNRAYTGSMLPASARVGSVPQIAAYFQGFSLIAKTFYGIYTLSNFRLVFSQIQTHHSPKPCVK